MPIIKSSIKDVRRIKRRTVRNQAARSTIRTAIKTVRAAKTVEEAKTALRNAMKVLDKAVSNGVLKKKTASRQKSRLSSMVQKKFHK